MKNTIQISFILSLKTAQMQAKVLIALWKVMNNRNVVLLLEVYLIFLED